ncbi:MAG: transglycosylase domain-containing protein, partial [Clostridia bacterium]|nr:transglycosylase domain-containing protein [Clostridia bacterium]
TNLKAGSFKQGASTISQQLIKNTHLSNDKTIKRKLKEIKLTKKLEKRYEKNQILEMYLNTIYFGHKCYGLQSAAEFYFNKKAEDLTLTESATIVGLLASPNNYSPFKNPEKSLSRRNLVLKNMLDCGYIDKTTYTQSIKEPLNAVQTTKTSKHGDYINAVFDELGDIDFNYYSLADGCIIKTYLNCKMQNLLEQTDYPCDNAAIVTDNFSGGVKAYKSTIGSVKRQPGSTVKPLFVYAPAIEEKQLSPFTKILDEKIDYGGYSPENFDKKYHGYVSVTDSLKYSYNVPAVKTLNALTIDKIEKYVTAMNLKLEDDEKNLSLALGGMKYGLSLKELADCYTIFPNGGSYTPSRFIKEIVSKDGKVLYQNKPIKSKVYSEGTCSLINDMLLETTESGTAKKLKNFDFDIASKTGTCGNTDGNTDAYAISYTAENCIAVWLGDKDNKRSQITGGNDCCKILQNALDQLYSEHKPEMLDTDSGTVTVKIDLEEYSENNKIVLADPVCPVLNTITVKVLKGNEPKIQSDRFSVPYISTPEISINNNAVNIKLCYAKYYSFIVKRTKNGKQEVIYDGKWQETICDYPKEGSYTYYVTPYFTDGKDVYLGKEITLPPVNLGSNTDSPQIKIPDIAHKDWYNQ